MTMLIATICPKFAVVSTDTYATDNGKVPAAAGPGHFLGYTNKVYQLPHLQMMMAGSGDARFLLSWYNQLLVCQKSLDIAAANDAAKARLPELHQKFGPDREQVVFQVGWSHTRGRVIGYVYESKNDFRPSLVEAGHTVMPTVNPEDPDYRDLAARWVPALSGRDVENFHVAYARNIYNSFKSGLLRPGAGVGGQLVTTWFDRNGFTVRYTHNFPDYKRPEPFEPGGDAEMLRAVIGED